VLSDPALAAQFGAEARRWVVADFQPDSVVRTLLAFGEGPTCQARVRPVVQSKSAV